MPPELPAVPSCSFTPTAEDAACEHESWTTVSPILISSAAVGGGAAASVRLPKGGNRRRDIGPSGMFAKGKAIRGWAGLKGLTYL